MTMTASEMGKKGGENRWKKVDKEKRSEMMREIANKRWAKKEKDLTKVQSPSRI